MRPALPVLLMLACGLAACSNRPVESATPPAPPEAPTASNAPAVGEDVISMGCLAEGAAWTIGQEPTDALVEKARVDAKARSARVIRLGQPVTMEYNGGRLNLHVGSNGKVKGVNCG